MENPTAVYQTGVCTGVINNRWFSAIFTISIVLFAYRKRCVFAVFFVMSQNTRRIRVLFKAIWIHAKHVFKNLFQASHYSFSKAWSMNRMWERFFYSLLLLLPLLLFTSQRVSFNPSHSTQSRTFQLYYYLQLHLILNIFVLDAF